MKPLKERISITIDGDVLNGIRALADNYERSLSQFINIILKDYLDPEKYSEALKKVLEGKKA